KWEYISRKEILLRMAVKLGGLEAERLIFGEDHMIFGAQIDVIEATSLATHFLKKSGLYDTPGAFHERHPSTREFLHHDSDELSRRAEEMLLQAKALAQKTLAAQRELLLKMSDYLSDNRQMLKP